jgi:GAF domain-containing protein/CheY-like chemotaxis protein/anti-sigma regulatory factor (Ser/Thr protein kinase)
MKTGSVGLAVRFGNRLRPLAVGVGILISLGLPLAYHALERKNLDRDAQQYARELSRRLAGRDLLEVMRDLSPRSEIARVRVLDQEGRVLHRYDNGVIEQGHWWDLHPTARRAAPMPAPGGVLTVEVTLAQEDLVAATVALLLLSTTIGAGLALAIYLYPVSVLRSIESGIDDVIRQQEGLLEASGLLASTLDLHGVLDRLSEIARSLPGIHAVRIWLVDEAHDRIRLHSQTGARHPDSPGRTEWPSREGLVGAVVESRRPLVLLDASTDPRVMNSAWFKSEDVASYLGVPMMAGDVVLGALACMSRTPRAWSSTEIALAETLGALGGVAIRNARNFGELTRRGERLRRVADLGRAVSGSLDLDAVLSRVMNAVLAVRSPDLGCSIRLVDQGPEDRRIAAAVPESDQPVPIAEALSSVVASSRQPLLVNDAPAELQGTVRRADAAPAQVYYGVPIQAGETLYGVLNVYFPFDAGPTADEKEAIELFAGQAAIAIRNARLFGESEARRRAAEALAEVGRVLAQALDPPGVGQRVVESLRTLLGAADSGLLRLEPETGDLVSLAAAGGGTVLLAPGVVLPRGTGSAGLATSTRELVVTPDALEDPRITIVPELRRMMECTGYSAMLAVPLIAKDRVIGALVAADRAGRVFNDDEIRLTQAFADQAALALDNARLYEDATRRRHEAEEIARVARSLTESLDVEHVARRVVEGAMSLLRAHSSQLALREPDGSLRSIAWGGSAEHHYPRDQIFPPGTGVIGRALAARAPVQVRDVLADADVILPDDIRAGVAASGDRAILAIPLQAKGELVAVLAVTDSAPRRFSQAEVELLGTFGGQAALVLDNARLYQNAQRAYEELSATQAQLVRGETLRAMGELASGVAHHLNNLLAVMLGRLQLARAKQPTPDVDRHLELAERAALDGAEVVRRMRDFGRAQPAADLSAVDLNRVAEEVLELTRPRWQDEAQMRGVRIEARIEAGDVPPVPGDASALREVLMNFVLNAIDALPHGGAITVRTWASAETAHCEIADTGVGMSPEVQRRALEPFFTTKGFQSTGLGLSVNYGIIRRHGGDLTIDSAVDGGTRITVRLPLGAHGDAGAAPPHAREDGPRLRILVIDDEINVRMTIAEMLSVEGHDVMEEPSGADGLARLDRERDVDLVLTDLGMPAMTGWEVARAVKAKRPSLRVGLLTGWGERPRAKAEERDAVDFVLAKPITAEGLRAALAGGRPESE